MIVDALRKVWHEPAVTPRPRYSWWDLALVPAAFALVVIDLSETNDYVAARIGAGFVLCVLLPFRRRWPLAIHVAVILAVEPLASYVVHDDSQVPAVALLAVIGPYALLRWDSGRNIVLGADAMIVMVVVALLFGPSGDVFSYLLFWGTPVITGFAVRSRASVAEGRLREAQLAERHRIARELHDSVAHHVSGISIQANAAQAVVATQPEAAAAAMRQVSVAASEALNEMRRMVATLRAEDGTIELRPQAGLGEIAELATGRTAPRVEVEMTGDLELLEPSIEAGLYRLAQESVTNASRHARHAKVVWVRVVGGPTAIELTVIDDGDTTIAQGRPRDGFGLVGMRERATLLGGSFDAGPALPHGWRVEARLPRRTRPAPVEAVG